MSRMPRRMDGGEGAGQTAGLLPTPPPRGRRRPPTRYGAASRARSSGSPGSGPPRLPAPRSRRPSRCQRPAARAVCPCRPPSTPAARAPPRRAERRRRSVPSGRCPHLRQTRLALWARARARARRPAGCSPVPRALELDLAGGAAVTWLWFGVLLLSSYGPLLLLPERALERGPYLRLMSLTSYVSRAFGQRDWVEHAAIDVYNRLAERRRRTVGKGELLVLIPRCLSKQALDGLLAIAGRYEVPVFVTTRGQLARRVIRARRARDQSAVGTRARR